MDSLRSGSGRSARVRCCLVTPEDANWLAAKDYAAKHFSKAVLIAGDMEIPLRTVTEFVLALKSEQILGIAARFHGFGDPSVTVSATTADAADALVHALWAPKGLLAVADDQILPSWSDHLRWTIDPWLSGTCAINLAAEDETESARDANEIAEFYDSVKACYWWPEMLPSGGTRVIRDRSNAIAAAVSVLFVLPHLKYAHIGGLITDPSYRRQGFGSALITAMRSDLARRGITKCGVFADACHPWLVEFYGQLGLSKIGAFRFGDMTSLPRTITHDRKYALDQLQRESQ
jgi:GNAT superfamily N-acetyltransferase